jgi:membrane protein YqaA with SNARE-associated domain
MIRLLTAIAVGLGGGFVSAFLPVVNAETLVAVESVGLHLGAVLMVAFAVALGQTAGKVVIYEAARRGRGSVEWFRRWRERRRSGDGAGERATAVDTAEARTGADTAADTTEPDSGEEPSGRWRRSLEWLQRPRTSAVIVLMSAGVGVPPLAVVSAAAGVARTPRVLFAVTCLIGRVIRFGVIAVLVGAATA